MVCLPNSFALNVRHYLAVELKQASEAVTMSWLRQSAKDCIFDHLKAASYLSTG